MNIFELINTSEESCLSLWHWYFLGFFFLVLLLEWHVHRSPPCWDPTCSGNVLLTSLSTLITYILKSLSGISARRVFDHVSNLPACLRCCHRIHLATPWCWRALGWPFWTWVTTRLDRMAWRASRSCFRALPATLCRSCGSTTAAWASEGGRSGRTSRGGKALSIWGHCCLFCEPHWHKTQPFFYKAHRRLY